MWSYQNLYSKKCDLVWQKETYSLSDCVTLWAHNFKRLQCISLKFSQDTLYAAYLWCAKCTGIDQPERKRYVLKVRKVERFAISPFLSDWVTNNVEYDRCTICVGMVLHMCSLCICMFLWNLNIVAFCFINTF